MPVASSYCYLQQMYVLEPHSNWLERAHFSLFTCVRVCVSVCNLKYFEALSCAALRMRNFNYVTQFSCSQLDIWPAADLFFDLHIMPANCQAAAVALLCNVAYEQCATA